MDGRHWHGPRAGRAGSGAGVAAMRALEATWGGSLGNARILISSDLGVGHQRRCPPPFAPRHRSPDDIYLFLLLRESTPTRPPPPSPPPASDRHAPASSSALRLLTQQLAGRPSLPPSGSSLLKLWFRFILDFYLKDRSSKLL